MHGMPLRQGTSKRQVVIQQGPKTLCLEIAEHSRERFINVESLQTQGAIPPAHPGLEHTIVLALEDVVMKPWLVLPLTFPQPPCCIKQPASYVVVSQCGGP